MITDDEVVAVAVRGLALVVSRAKFMQKKLVRLFFSFQKLSEKQERHKCTVSAVFLNNFNFFRKTTSQRCETDADCRQGRLGIS